MMKKLVFICPYFGKLPIDQMKLWLKSCEYNNNYDWIIFTDDHTSELTYPQNVHVIYTTLEDTRKLIQSRFDFTISLDNPYKLCDYKPAYGYIFQEYIKGYDYWGHCDMTDCIFGDLSKFLNDELFAKGDKFGFLGHMTIYRNNDDVNKRIFAEVNGDKDNIKKIFGTHGNHAFDETNPTSINSIYTEHSWELVRFDEIYRDVSPGYKAFVRTSYDEDFKYGIERSIRRIFEWKNGHLYDCMKTSNDAIIKTEIGYVHFQKRKMLNLVRSDTHYYIIPNKFIDAEEPLNVDFIKNHSNNKIWYLQHYKLKYKNLKYYIKRFFTTGKVSRCR